MILEQVIEQYTNQLPSRYKDKVNTENHLRKIFESNDIIKEDITSLSSQVDPLIQCALDYVRGYTGHKNKLAKVIRDFSEYLIKKYNFKLDIENELSDMKFLAKDKRQLEILKYLHQGSKTRGDIAEYFNVSETTLSNDLKELQDGISFMGHDMKIKLERGTNTYDSTIHPVFLPLNLSEVYALTVGLKSVGNRRVFQDIFEYIADNIYAQLSEYGQERIGSRAEESDINFESPIHMGYRYEKELLASTLAESRSRMLAYYLKSGEGCEVEHDTGEGIKRQVGRIKYVNNGEKIELIDENQKSSIIKIDKLVKIQLKRQISS